LQVEHPHRRWQPQPDHEAALGIISSWPHIVHSTRRKSPSPRSSIRASYKGRIGAAELPFCPTMGIVNPPFGNGGRAVRVIVLTRLARRFIPAQIQSFSLIGKRPPCGRDPEDRLPVFLCDRVLGQPLAFGSPATILRKHVHRAPP
jgi:hypothetical protein